MLFENNKNLSLSDWSLWLDKIAKKMLSEQNYKTSERKDASIINHSNCEISSKIKYNLNDNKDINIISDVIKGKFNFDSSTTSKEEEYLTNSNDKKEKGPISLCPRYGRIPKKFKNVLNGKHNNKSKDNVRRKLFRACILSIDKYIRNRCKKYDISLHILNIKPQLGISLDDYDRFFEKKLIDIYAESKPKRKTDKNIYYNKKQIQKVLNKEKQDKKAKIKILNILLNMNFREIFIKYLYNIPFIILTDYYCQHIKYDIIGFKTYKNDLDEFNEDEKEYFKKDAQELLKNNITHRSKRGNKNKK